MARLHRNPKLRQQLVYALAAAEALALAGNFYGIFWAYLHQISLRLGDVGKPLLSTTGEQVVVLIGTAVCLAVAIIEAVPYVKDRPWARWAFITENAVLVLMGLVWFIHNRVGSTPDPYAARMGILLPMLTLFPLLWPLLVFRPKHEPEDAQGQGG